MLFQCYWWRKTCLPGTDGKRWSSRSCQNDVVCKHLPCTRNSQSQCFQSAAWLFARGTAYNCDCPPEAQIAPQGNLCKQKQLSLSVGQPMEPPKDHTHTDLPHIIRRPPLWGHHGCGSRMPSAFQQASVLLSAVQPFAVKLFTRPKFHVIYHRHPRDFASRSLLNMNQLSGLSPRQQKSEKLLLPMSPETIGESTPKS